MKLFLLILPALFSFKDANVEPRAAPPGTVQVSENLYIDTEAMRNMDWMEFLYAVKQDSSQAFYRAMLPDTSKFVNGKNYFYDPKFRDKPLTGITYQQALAFCKWRSDLVSANIANPEAVCEAGKPLYLKFDKAYKITYRLPKPEELKTLYPKPKKLQITEAEEMTNEAGLVVVSSFSKKVSFKKLEPANGLKQTFRCVAYFENR